MSAFLFQHIIALNIIILTLTHASQFFDLFRQDCAKLSNEKTFNEGIDHWRSLFSNDSIIEMNDRVFAGSSEIDGYFLMHKSTFRRIQFDLIGENTIDDSIDGILSLTLYATYVPREYFGCSSMMRWLAIFWYSNINANATGGRMGMGISINKMLLSSSTSLVQWQSQLQCDWVANKEEILYTLNNLMYGMYRDSDVEQMVHNYYAINSKLYISDGSGNNSYNNNYNIIEGRDNIILWYLEWTKLGVSNVLNEIDEIDISGNNVVMRMVTIASHSSGKCSQSFMWYALYKFNGKAKIIKEQRFYHQKQLENSKLILKNCGDLSPLPKTDL
eukprot:244353_1